MVEMTGAATVALLMGLLRELVQRQALHAQIVLGEVGRQVLAQTYRARMVDSARRR